MTIASKEALLARRYDTVTGYPEDTVEVPGLGEVRVRGLSRFEAMHVQNAKGAAATERLVVSLGLVEPTMTETEVGQWQRTSVGNELDAVSTRIGQLSGMLPDSPKQAYKDFEVDPGEEFRVLPGTEAVDDGGETPGGDQ